MMYFFFLFNEDTVPKTLLRAVEDDLMNKLNSDHLQLGIRVPTRTKQKVKRHLWTKCFLFSKIQKTKNYAGICNIKIILKKDMRSSISDPDPNSTAALDTDPDSEEVKELKELKESTGNKIK
jgi:hypothetical protein